MWTCKLTHSNKHLHVSKNTQSEHEAPVYQCSSSCVYPRWSSECVNDLYCPSLLIEHQLKFPSSQSERQVLTYTVTAAEPVCVSLISTCDVVQHKTNTHEALLKHKFPPHFSALPLGPVSTTLQVPASLLCFTANPSI